MNLGAFFCLLLAHFIVDFPLQSKKIVNLKNDKNWRVSLAGNSLHACVYFFISLAAVLYYFSFKILLIVLITSILHGSVDFIKSLAILDKPFRKFSVSVFLIDQFTHLIVITLVFLLVDKNPQASSMVKTQLVEIVSLLNHSINGITHNQKIALAFIFLLIGLWGVGIFIRIYFNGMKLKEYSGAINQKIELVMHSKVDGTNDGGFIIGMLERFFIIISILLNMPLVIGFILTAKSVARLKKFDDDRFVEIFIIGSFISFISATIIGYIIKLLNVIPY